jgi:site-specific recombinase XerD
MLELKDRYISNSAGLSPLTKKVYKQRLNDFFKSVNGKQIITAEDVEKFLNLLKKKNYKTSTVNGYISAIRSFYDWADLNYDVKNIARRVKLLPTLPPDQRIITTKEYEKLLKTLQNPDKAVIAFLANTGLRAEEFLSLSRMPKNIHTDYLVINGKGTKQRLVPVNSTIEYIISSYPRLNFRKNRPLTKAWLDWICHKAAHKAEIPHFTAHSLRHYFATSLKISGVETDVISVLLGHSSPLVTSQVYIHWTFDDLRGKTNCLDKYFI